MNDNRKYIVLSLITGGLLIMGILLLLSIPLHVVQARSSILFASTTGSGSACIQSAPCSLQTALTQATDSSKIYVAGGTYTGSGTAVITLNKSVVLYGGWNGAPTGPVVRDPVAYPTVLDGQRSRRVVLITGNVAPTLNGFVIAHGNASGLSADCHWPGGDADGCGGGIAVYGAHPIIVNNVITDNIAVITPVNPLVGITGYGGGIYLYDANDAFISNNVIISNVASTAKQGMGGGVFIGGTANGLVLQDNQILNNIATSGTGMGWGGGVAGGPDGAFIRNNLIQGNRAKAPTSGAGGGIFQWFGSAEYRGNLVRENYAGTAVYLGYSSSLFDSNVVVDNHTRSGILLIYSPGPTLVNNAVIRSAIDLYSIDAYATASTPLLARLIHNTLVGSGVGHGVYIESDYVTLFITNTIIVNHAWGITNSHSPLSIVSADHTLFWGNTNNGFTGVNPVFGNPRLDPDGIHLLTGSAAIDAGLNAGVSQDIDRELRPFGAGYEIGADEYLGAYYFYLPLLPKNHP